MIKYLVTPTLIQSWQYWMNYDGENEQSVHNSFLSTLKREKTEPTQAMLKGIEFEKKIIECASIKPWEDQEYLASIENNPIDPVLSIAEIVTDGMFQTVLKKEITCNSYSLLLYGKADAIKEDMIYDIKYTSSYEVGKFANSVQHLLYLYCANLEKFDYLISDGESFWRESYYLTSETIQSNLLQRISEFLSWLEDHISYKTIYQNKWLTQY